jgi:alpha-beta hydrolase superfamily lysophospholipase
VCEYYEEIGKAIKVLRADGIGKILLFGHGSGGVIAAHYASDHPEEVDGLLVTSPLVAFHSNLPGMVLFSLYCIAHTLYCITVL